jgi:hypothetical protein
MPLRARRCTASRCGACAEERAWQQLHGGGRVLILSPQSSGGVGGTQRRHADAVGGRGAVRAVRLLTLRATPRPSTLSSSSS